MLICFVTMRNNYIFLAFFAVEARMFSNSLLARSVGYEFQQGSYLHAVIHHLQSELEGDAPRNERGFCTDFSATVVDGEFYILSFRMVLMGDVSLSFPLTSHHQRNPH
ncbi:hypothetical protein B0H17DRAFT_673693 [Mycena rosella]|uniref:Uncharacterized protein n=1 Tax=Mycena rosella TaxID=1033263 RepID=A0AAD7DC15_MYCRO|nr:hypothetical protein B0H17DRAFT_673693 [Mycena rosella]